jgi:hypothetical protein
VTRPEYQALASPRVLNHVGVTTMKRLYKGHLHPLLEPRAACVTGEHSSKELFEQLMLLLFGTSTVRVPFFSWLLSTYLGKKIRIRIRDAHCTTRIIGISESLETIFGFKVIIL